MRSSPPATGVESFPPSRHPSDPFGFWSVCGSGGLLFFRLSLLLHPFPYHDKEGDFDTYLLGWFVFFPLGLMYGSLAEYLRRRWVAFFPLFYPLIVFLHSFALLVFLHPRLMDAKTTILLAFLTGPHFLVMARS